MPPFAATNGLPEAGELALYSIKKCEFYVQNTIQIALQPRAASEASSQQQRLARFGLKTHLLATATQGSCSYRLMLPRWLAARQPVLLHFVCPRPELSLP